MSENKFDPKSIIIDDIVIIDAAIANDNNLNPADTEIELEMSTSMNLGISESTQKVRLIHFVNIEAKNSLTGESVGISAKFHIAYFFKIESLTSLITKTDNSKPVISGTLVSNLGQLAHGTSRGIIYTRCQGTIMKKVIIPVSTASDFFKPGEPFLMANIE
jgi:hypothetical protein